MLYTSGVKGFQILKACLHDALPSLEVVIIYERHVTLHPSQHISMYRNDPKFRTDWSVQIVQTQIRLLLEEQSDQGLHYLQYCLHLLDALLYGKTSFFQF